MLREKKYPLRAIAKTLKRAASTISDELKRNAVHNAYDAKKAYLKSYQRRRKAKYQSMKIVKSPALRSFVEEKLLDDQSPQAIAGRIKKKEKHLPTVSKNSIYRYIRSAYGGKIEAHRYVKRQRKKRRKTKKAISTPHSGTLRRQEMARA